VLTEFSKSKTMVFGAATFIVCTQFHSYSPYSRFCLFKVQHCQYFRSTAPITTAPAIFLHCHDANLPEVMENLSFKKSFYSHFTPGGVRVVDGLLSLPYRLKHNMLWFGPLCTMFLRFALESAHWEGLMNIIWHHHPGTFGCTTPDRSVSLMNVLTCST
jgi:hypothetical protein